VGTGSAQLGRMFATHSFILSEEIWNERMNQCLLLTLPEHLSEVIILLTVLLIYLARFFSIIPFVSLCMSVRDVVYSISALLHIIISLQHLLIRFFSLPKFSINF
jgi:hypothetical protein